MEYTIQVAGLTRHLPLCPVHENLTIAAFVIFGDVELSIACARDLLKIAPDHDVLILRHVCHQHGHQLINHALALLRAVHHDQWRQIAQ